MLVDFLDLERRRTRIERIEQHHVAHRTRRDAAHVARAVGDLRINEIERHFEIVGGCAMQSEIAGEPERVDAALDALAEIEKMPSGEPVHILLCEAGNRIEDLQRAFETLLEVDAALVAVDMRKPRL